MNTNAAPSANVSAIKARGDTLSSMENGLCSHCHSDGSRGSDELSHHPGHESRRRLNVAQRRQLVDGTLDDVDDGGGSLGDAHDVTPTRSIELP